MPTSEELAALIRRAEDATANARRLLYENDRLRRYAERQLDCLFELGAEFRRPTLARPISSDRFGLEDRQCAVRSTRDGAAIPSGSA